MDFYPILAEEIESPVKSESAKVKKDGKSEEELYDEALAVMTTEPKRVISTVKNAMGEDRTYKIPNMSMSFRSQDISSFVLRKLVKDAETFLDISAVK